MPLEPAPVVADALQRTASAAPAIAPPAAASPDQRDGDVLVAALGLAGLLAAQGPQARDGRRRLDWDAMRCAAGNVLQRLREAVGSISRK